MMRSLPKRILDAYWFPGEDGTLIKWADEEKRQHITEAPFNPYFFIHEEDLGKSSSQILGSGAWVERGDYLSIRGKRCVKVECKYPARYENSVKSLREKLKKLGIEVFEADIPFIRRVLIDEDIKQCPIEERVYVDMEADARKGFPDPSKAPYRILSISAVGTDGKEYFFSDEDEVEMVREFFLLLRKKYHLITGWNWRGWDGPYLQKRTRNLGMKGWMFPIQDIDVMLNYKKITIWGFTGKSYRLTEVAKRHLGIDHETVKDKIGIAKLWDSFVGDKKDLYEYNMTDAKLVRDLDHKLQLCDPYLEICYEYPLFMRYTPSMATVWDTILLKRAQESDVRIVFPSRKKASGELKGGYVSKPKSGVYRNMVSMDFKSLYPSIMRSFMLSPEMMFLYQSYKKSGKSLEEWMGGLGWKS